VRRLDAGWRRGEQEEAAAAAAQRRGAALSDVDEGPDSPLKQLVLEQRARLAAARQREAAAAAADGAPRWSWADSRERTQRIQRIARILKERRGGEQ
jgi:hypothetical protein